MGQYVADKLIKMTSVIENKPLFIALKHGMVMAVPFIITGSMCLMLTSFPAAGYQRFIQGVFGGALLQALNIIYSFTMGMLAMIMLWSVSYSYGRECDTTNSKYYPFVASMAYYIFVCDDKGNISVDMFGYNWLFTAIVISLLSSIFLNFFLKITHRERKLYSDGADRHFVEAMRMLLPVIIEALIFVISRMLIIEVAGETGIQNIGSAFYMSIFTAIKSHFIRGLVFIILSHIFWIFGIHGNNILNEISTTIMDAGSFSKSFLDTFVLMGGCGTCLCLMIAILIAARQRNNRMLVRAGFIPEIFNISEIFVFGFPIILNPIMVIPFITTPVICYLIASLAVWIGIIPVNIGSINWTSPVIYSGIKVTGSIMGGIVQIVCIIAGVCIYIPFIRLAEKYQKAYVKENIVRLCGVIADSELDGSFDKIEGQDRRVDSTVRMLIDDLHLAIHDWKIELFYQPQVNYSGELTGCEVLLRWNHPLGGYIYPPLVIALANYDGFLDELELYVLDRACTEAEYICNNIGDNIKISLNITPEQLKSDDFCTTAIDKIRPLQEKEINIDFEITEQIALESTPIMNNNIRRLQKAGIRFEMDDFGMGHSSLMYLQSNDFAVVKLDGRLVKDINTNKNSLDIIKTIVDLSGRMNFNVIAEYVENEDIKEKLHSVGCECYQGYMYSKPLPVDEFIKYAKK